LEWINEKATAYSGAFSSEEDDILHEISTYTAAKHPDPGMLSGHVQGKLLQMISCMIRPHRVLEIGTMTGYSAICLAEGLAKDGTLHTIELREKDAYVAKGFVIRSKFSDRIIVHTGEALTIIETLNEEWDLVFIDADKINYVRYYEAVLPFVRQGGFILADNVLFHGEVLENQVKGKNARAIKAFNDHVQLDKRVENVLMTIRDGLMLIRKK
jgi:caffeoyl-CoA O-methyltransferase